MTAISTWSQTPASNNSASPDGFPEGMAPSGVNDSAREVMASVRAWYDAMEWRDLGHTITYVAATQFKISGVDYSAIYVVGRRVHANGSATGDIYGTITAVAFSTDTTVTVVWDSGSLSNEALTVEVGWTPSNHASGPLIGGYGATALSAPGGFTTVASFTGIPAWAKRITLMISGVSLSGTDSVVFQIGDSGGAETTGYTTISTTLGSASQSAAGGSAGWLIEAGGASSSVTGVIVLVLLDRSSNTWVASGVFSNVAASNFTHHLSGLKALTATLDRVQMTRSGTDTFDAGTVNIIYE